MVALTRKLKFPELEPVYLDSALEVEPTLIQLTATGTFDIPVDNCMGFTHTLKAGVLLGRADIESPSFSDSVDHPPSDEFRES